MNSPDCSIDIIRGNEATPVQAEFINHWNQHYFGEVETRLVPGGGGRHAGAG